MEFFNSAFGKNITFVRPAFFKISGFIGIPDMNYYYVFLLFVFLASVLGNTAVMTVICLDHNLRTAKYVAVFNLAFVDLLGNTVLVPKVIDIFLFNHYYISYNDCITHMFFCFICLGMQSLNLVALCYDRLIAIMYPLHYQVRVTPKKMLSLIGSFWLFVVFCFLILVGLMTRISFCESVVINSFYCDHGPMHRLACNDATPNLVYGNLLIALLLWVPLLIIMCSYICIGRTLAKISTAKERVKAFKTCTSHLSLVAIYFIPILIVYNMRANIHPNARIINLSLTAIFPPMLNPIVYVLQTQEIRTSLRKILKCKKQSQIALK
ncbi:olfactory receptor 1-like [Oryzias melastigma]|uniref:olfactory receptor 1-like n=1 Tax=Oryzias melastigma TaxID=30732 RepID=UPI000CF82BD2|nr:olfactory receptor 1-like [Oryzias melastigma]